MFNHQQHQQQQSVQQLQQRVQQQPRPHHRGGRPPVRLLGPPGLFCPTATPQPPAPLLLASNPLLQGALYRHPMRGLMVSRGLPPPPPPPLLPPATGTRQSLLGAAPLAVTEKSCPVGLLSRPYRPHLTKEVPARKRERETAGGGEGHLSLSHLSRSSIEGDPGDDGTAHTAQSQGAPQPEPPKRQRMNGSKEPIGEGKGERALEDQVPTQDTRPTECDGCSEPRGSPGGLSAEGCSEDSQPAEVVGVGPSLKVTIQRSSESRAFSTGLEDPAGTAVPPTGQEENRYYCHLCNASCHNQERFQSHMSSVAHQKRMMEVQHSVLSCTHTALQGTHTDRGRGQGVKRWCATCQSHFSGDLILHRRTQQHKLCKQSSRPFCPTCKRHFRTPRSFVEHMKSPEHKKQVEELREEAELEVLEEELITVDAVGCFEGEEDYEEESQEDEETRGEQPAQRELLPEDQRDEQKSKSDTLNGSSFVVPVSGFLCQLCRKFFHLESTARLSHCNSFSHLQNLQRYNALRKQSCSAVEDRDTHGIDSTDTLQAQPGDVLADQRPVLTPEDEAELSDSPGSDLIPDQLDCDIAALPRAAVTTRGKPSFTYEPLGPASEQEVQLAPCRRSSSSTREEGHDGNAYSDGGAGGGGLRTPAGVTALNHRSRNIHKLMDEEPEPKNLTPL